MAVNKGPFNGRLALVTGGGGGIGAAICRTLADKGARVVVAGITFDAVRAVAADLPGPADHRAVQFDAADSASVQALFNAIRGFSNVPATILVNCFGRSPPTTPFENTTDEMFHFAITNNVKGTFQVCRAAVLAMLEAGVTEGAIVNLSTQTAKSISPGYCCYVTSKGAIEALTRSMAVELAPYGIRCNCVAPGITNTPKAALLPETLLRYAEKNTPFGRAARPEEVASVVAFLCSPDSSYVIGEIINVA